MKFLNRTMALLLVLLLTLSMVPAAHAETSDKTVSPDTTVTVYFSYEDIFGIDGTFSVEDPDNIIQSWKVGNPNASGMGGNIGGVTCYLYSNTNPVSAGSVSIPVILTINASAPAGKSATVSFHHALCTDALGTMSSYRTDSSRITIESKGGGITEDPPIPGDWDPSRIDYSELERQIAIANGLNQSEYTSDSWSALTAAMAKAEDALTSKNQDTVDSAARGLASAITALVKMDYKALNEALEAAADFAKSEDVFDLWIKLAEAVNRGKELLTSGDQAAVDTCAQEIQNILAQLIEKLGQQEPQTIIQEVPVEVPPQDDYCNMPMHKVWPVLFFISLALNVGLVALIAIFIVRRQKSLKDDTPLVEYDIDDDF